MKRNLLAVLIISSGLILSACNDDDNHNSSVSGSNGTDINQIANPVVNTPVAYKKSDLSNVAAESVVMTYKMKGISGSEVQATALVFTPKTAVPAGGWPIVVWAHGTTGVADKCAPSRNQITGSTLDLITKLLSAGYVVVAPDYEGLGDPSGTEAHPFLNVKSEGYSITDAVVAARNWLGVKASNQWVTVGHSQGGQAALGAAQYASRANLNYKGTVAVAPASNLKLIFKTGIALSSQFPATQQVDTVASLNTYGALIVAGMQGQASPPTYDQVFQPQASMIASNYASNVCADDLEENYFSKQMSNAADTNNSLNGYYTQSNFLTIPSIQTFLDNTSQPLTTKVSTPIKIYQGLNDTTILPIATTQLVADAALLGTKIEVDTGNWTHDSAMDENVDNIVGDVKAMMAK